jgi:hypothetical protein
MEMGLLERIDPMGRTLSKNLSTLKARLPATSIRRKAPGSPNWQKPPCLKS